MEFLSLTTSSHVVSSLEQLTRQFLRMIACISNFINSFQEL